MNPWNTYEGRMVVRGNTRREASVIRTQRQLDNRIPSSLSYHVVHVNGEQRDLVILNSDNLDTKTLCTLPGEDLPHGGYVDWMDQHWIITERDANTEIYTKAIMRQCNYLLRWVNDEGIIVERWCIVEDGTKYLSGEFGDNSFVIMRGDSRISVTIPRDSETVKLNRTSRFIIDDYGSTDPIAYRLTKPLKMGFNYNGEGVYVFVMLECAVEPEDNIELHIADYYKHFPRECKNEDCTCDDSAPDTERVVWI